MKTRFYFHGDLMEGKADTYYCAFCDSFLWDFLNHIYTDHPTENDWEKLRSSKRIYQALDKKQFFRPKSADRTNLA